MANDTRKIPLVEVPARIGGSYAKAWALAVAGELETKRDGARIFVTERSISDYLKAHESED